jgi:hypothetical protein
MKELIRNILKEETDNTELERLKNAVKKMIKTLTKEAEFPENFYDFMVDIKNVEFFKNEKILIITTVMKKPFNEEELEKIYPIRKLLTQQLKAFFGGSFDRVHSGGTSTLEVYLRDKERDTQYPNF